MIDPAIESLSAGLCVLPAILDEKRPPLAGWKQYQRRLPTERQVRTWFADYGPLCVLTGAVSGNLEMIDFDYEGGELFDRWRELVATEMPGFVERLVVERSQSGGRHVVYREAVPDSRKLAQRTVVAEGSEAVVIAGKRHVPRRVGDRYEITCTLISTTDGVDLSQFHVGSQRDESPPPRYPDPGPIPESLCRIRGFVSDVMADSNAADNPFHADCLKLIKKLREVPDQTLPHQVLLKRMKMKTKDFRELVETLIQSGDVQSISKRTRGRTGIHDRFIGEGGDAVKEPVDNEGQIR